VVRLTGHAPRQLKRAASRTRPTARSSPPAASRARRSPATSGSASLKGGPHVGNEEVASAFDEMAELLAIKGENRFRIGAYQRAAQLVRSLPKALSDFGSVEALDELPGIGPDLASKIDELLRSGRMRALNQLRSKVPRGLRELLRLPGLGPARVRALHSGLGVDTVADLRQALDAGRLQGLRGFGSVLQSGLRAALEAGARQQQRWLWTTASQHAAPLCAHLEAVAGVAAVVVAGSYRRGCETVGDLDILVTGSGKTNIGGALREYQGVREVTASGPTRCTVALRNGMQVDSRLVAPISAGAALLYFTGSKQHNLRMRQRAQARQLKLNEYGLFRGRKRIAGKTEADVFEALGIPWIPPELREDRGEIEAAERGELPELIELKDIQGDLHAHTDASDGHEDLNQLVAAARAHGLRFMAVTDHSRYLGIVRGLDADRLARQIDEIDALNAKLRDFVVLKGTEVDILEDGGLALPDSILRRLEVVVAAVHGHFALPRQKQTARILRALDGPFVSILAHPTGRLLNERAAYDVDFQKIVETARSRPCFLELNSQPTRLDLNDAMCRVAKEQGVLVSIASDAHSGLDFADLAAGIRQARRGWLTARDVLNARPLSEVRAQLQRTRLAT